MNRKAPSALALSALAMALMVGGCGADPEAAAAKARDAYAAHNYLAAQTDLGIAMAAHPNDAGLLELHARNALAMGDGIAAGASLEKLAALISKPADFNRLLAEAALLRGQTQEALTALGDDKSAAGLRLKGLALLTGDNKAAAEQAFQSALAADPKHAPSLASFARLKLLNGDTPAARGLADQALAADGHLLDALLVDGQVATAEGQLGKALAAYAKAGKEYPGNLPALTGQAGILGDLGRTDELAALLAGFQGKTTDGTLAYLKARLASAKGTGRPRATYFRPMRTSSRTATTRRCSMRRRSARSASPNRPARASPRCSPAVPKALSCGASSARRSLPAMTPPARCRP